MADNQSAGIPALTAGTRVRVAPLGLDGVLAAAPASDGICTVLSGELRVQCAVADLLMLGPAAAGVVAAVQVHATPAAATQLDLHGLTGDEAAAAADRFLNRAFCAGVPLVRLVHGKGGGALRQALHALLDGHPLVAAFRHGWYGEGDSGVTVVTLQPRGRL